jgi:hypothetical protein
MNEPEYTTIITPMPQLRRIFSTDAAQTYAPFDVEQRRRLSGSSTT